MWLLAQNYKDFEGSKENIEIRSIVVVCLSEVVRDLH